MTMRHVIALVAIVLLAAVIGVGVAALTGDAAGPIVAGAIAGVGIVMVLNRARSDKRAGGRASSLV
ncbi:MAG: hypothetical protein Q8O56_04715 [Solirubrobacteraceae bacterium]|nr:hypothetical protein [Solirubrobacteraceae bacterium]